MFFFKHRPEIEAGRLVQDLCLYFKKLYIMQKQVFSTSVLISVGKSLLGYATKTNFITFYTVDPEISSILIF